MLWLSIEVSLVLLFGTAIAPNSAREVVILALAADPAAIWKGEILFLFLRVLFLCLSLVEL